MNSRRNDRCWPPDTLYVLSSVIKVWVGERIVEGMQVFATRLVLSNEIEDCRDEGIVEGITDVCQKAGSF